MFHGLRQYETLHRLWWFVFFFLCLVLARYSPGFTQAPRQGPELKDIGKIEFWTGLQGIRMTSLGPEYSRGKEDQPDRGAGPQTGKSTNPDKSKQGLYPSSGQNDYLDNIGLVSRALLFIIRAGIIFLELRLLWLLIQYAGRYLLQLFISESEHYGARNREQARTGQGSLFPLQILFDRIGRSPLSFVLHPFIRLRLMLSGSQKYFSSEELFEKERRVVEADWRILYGSWGPYQSLFWILPLLGLAQTVLLLIAQFGASSSGLALPPQKEALDIAKPLLSVQKEILDAIKPTFNLVLPLVQAAGMGLFFQLAATLLRHLEELYLSNLDAFIYDRVLSKLPLRSTDTDAATAVQRPQCRPEEVGKQGFLPGGNRETDMKRIGSSTKVGSLLTKFLGRHPAFTANPIGDWKDLVGEQVARYTVPKSLKNKVLVILAHDSVWKHHLEQLKEVLTEKINCRRSERIIEKITIKVAEMPESAPLLNPAHKKLEKIKAAKTAARRKSKAPTRKLTPEEQSLIKNLPDPDLQKIAEKLLRHSLN
jgi:hypothetical protein